MATSSHNLKSTKRGIYSKTVHPQLISAPILSDYICFAPDNADTAIMQTMMCDKDLFLLHTKNNQRFSLIYSVVSMSSPLFADIIDGYSILCSLIEVRRAIFPYRKPWNFLMAHSL